MPQCTQWKCTGGDQLPKLYIMFCMVVFRKRKSMPLILRSPVECTRDVEGLVLLQQSLTTARGVRHVPNVHATEGRVWRAGIAGMSFYHWGHVSVKWNTWWRARDAVTSLHSYSFDALNVNMSCALSTYSCKRSSEPCSCRWAAINIYD